MPPRTPLDDVTPITQPVRFCPCGKRAFLTEGEARSARRRWQRHGRNRSFNDQHIYRCDVDRRYLHLGGAHG